MVPVLLYQDRKTEESCLGSSSTYLVLGNQLTTERLFRRDTSSDLEALEDGKMDQAIDDGQPALAHLGQARENQLDKSTEQTVVDEYVREENGTEQALKDEMIGEVLTCSPRKDDEAPSTIQSTMSTRHSLFGHGKQVYMQLQHTDQSLEVPKRMQEIKDVHFPDCNKSIISPELGNRTKRFNITSNATVIITTWSTDASLEEFSMINQVNMIKRELPGTAPVHCSTLGVEKDLMKNPVSQPHSIQVSNTATDVDHIWPTDTSLAEHNAGDEVISDQVNVYERVIPGTAPAYCSRVDGVRSQLLQDDVEILFASPGQQQKQRVKVKKRRIFTQKVKDENRS